MIYRKDKDGGHCPDCKGLTIEFRGEGLDTKYNLCARYKEDGHLSMEEIQELIADYRRDSMPSSGRLA